MEKNIYWEPQRGNNCRIHSINAFFGYKKITESDFNSFCKEYDKIIPGLKSINMDGFAEARCIISYILSKIDNSHTILIPINKYQNARSHINIDRYEKLVKEKKIKSYFEFNPNHVWLNKYIDSKKMWFKIDSISGVNPIDPRINYNQNGIILVINEKTTLGNEIIYYIKNLTGNIVDDELNLFNLHHSINAFKSKLSKNTYKNLNNMEIFLDNYVKEKRSQLSNNFIK